MKKFWKWNDAVESVDSELIIEGVISDEPWFGDEVTPKELRDELAKQTGDITVSINSGGGDVFAGVAMYNALMEYKGKVTVRVDGLAASIASVIAMAGDKIIMSPGSMMMIHKPWTMAVGDSNEMEKVREILDGIESSILPIYQSRTGRPKEEIAELLNAETWLTAEEAVEMGFADELLEAKTKISFSDSLKASLAFKSEVAICMSATKKSLETLEIQLEEEDLDKPETPETEVKEETKVETTVETEVQKPEPEETETVEETAPVEEDNKVVDKKKETVTMSKQDETAAVAVVAALPEQPAVEQKQSVKSYLKTKGAMEDFAQILQAQAGNTSDDVKDAWKAHIETKMGVTNPEIFLPDALITEIEDAFREGGEIWNRVTKTGADVWKAAWDSATDPSAEAGRGKGYNRDEEEIKAEQTLTFATRILRPQFIYKYITLNKEDIKNQRSTGALVRFVLSELPRRIVREVERAIVLSDGRTDGSDYKIQEGTPEGFFPIINDTLAENVFGDTYTPEDGENHYSAVVRASDLLEAPGRPVLIAKKGYVTEMKLTQNSSEGYIFPLGADFNGILGVEAVIEPDWFTDATSPDVDAFLVILPNYRVVGDTSIEAFTNFILRTNKQEYLQEIYAGGGLTVRKTAVAIGAGASS